MSIKKSWQIVEATLHLPPFIPRRTEWVNREARWGSSLPQETTPKSALDAVLDAVYSQQRAFAHTKHLTGYINTSSRRLTWVRRIRISIFLTLSSVGGI